MGSALQPVPIRGIYMFSQAVTCHHTCSVYLVSEEGGLWYRLVPCIQTHDSQQFHTGVNKARPFLFYFICGIQRESWVQSPLVTRIVWLVHPVLQNGYSIKLFSVYRNALGQKLTRKEAAICEPAYDYVKAQLPNSSCITCISHQYYLSQNIVNKNHSRTTSKYTHSIDTGFYARGKLPVHPLCCVSKWPQAICQQ